MLFQDPIHEIKGIDHLKKYFSGLNENFLKGTFRFSEESIANDKVYLCWEMDLTLKKPRKQVKASGISVLTLVDGKIAKHRDYFDAGELFYEHIPILGGIIKFLKRKLAE